MTIEIKRGITDCGVVDLDALKADELRKLGDVEGAAADQIHHIGAGAAGEAVARSQRRRRAIDSIVARNADKRVHAGGKGKTSQRCYPSARARFRKRCRSI